MSMKESLFISIFGIPLFLLIFLEKCVDWRSYRKLGMIDIDNTEKILSREFLILFVAQILNNAAIICLLSTIEGCAGEISLFMICSPLPIQSLMLMHALERKSVQNVPSKHSLPKKSFVTDWILAIIFGVTYPCFLIWCLVNDLNESDWFGGDNSKVNTKWGIIWLIGTILLLIVFALIKILVQKQLVKRIRNQLLTEQVPSENAV